MRCSQASGPWQRQKSAITLPVQKTDYTCGIAAVEALYAVLGQPCPLSTEDLQATLGARPRIGVDNDVMADWLAVHAPVSSYGEDTWYGCIAIANVYYRDEFIESGHYELFLGKLNGVVHSWCPWLGKIRQRSLEDIEWRSGDDQYRHWSINSGIRLEPEELRWLTEHYQADDIAYPERIRRGLATRTW